MTFNIITANGQLGSSEGELYAPVVGVKSYVKNILLRNTSGGAETVQLYLTLHNAISEFPTILLGAGESAVISSFGMSGGDIISGYSTTASVIDYVVSAVEEVS